VAGPVLADRNSVAAAKILGVQADRIGHTAAVDTQCGPVDVIQGVSLFVVVRVEWLIGGTAPQLRLLRRHLDFSTGEQPAGCNPGRGEPVIVGSAVERRVLRGLACGVEVGGQ